MVNKWATPPQDRRQRILFGASLDEQIAADDPIRLLGEILSELDWTEWECSYSDGAGRPPVQPRLMARATLYGMMNRIRSSRDLQTATRMRVDFHWLLGCMSIGHSTFARFRNRFGGRLEALRKDLNREAREVMQAGPKRIAVDSGLVVDGPRVQMRRLLRLSACQEMPAPQGQGPNRLARGYEPLREDLAARMRTDDAKEAYSRRAPSIEGTLGCVKGGMGIRDFLTRGHEKVRTEWRWICGAYNMRKLMGLLTAKRAASASSAQDSALNSRDDTASPRILALPRLYWPRMFGEAA